ncbi:MAG: outer membrane beta-barrel protein, partial [Bacteroidetes bacterium]|nr:outer membrane beta-barrel protein [Bacteroidota bacterium]
LLFNSEEIVTPIKVVDTEKGNDSQQSIIASDNKSTTSNKENINLNDLNKSNTINSTENLEENSAIVKTNNINHKNDSNELTPESLSNKNSTYSTSKNNVVVISDSKKGKSEGTSSNKSYKKTDAIPINNLNQNKTKQRKDNSQPKLDNTKDNIHNSSTNYGLASKQPNTSNQNISNQVDGNAEEKNTHPKLDANATLSKMKENTGLADNEDSTEIKNTIEEEAIKDSTSIEEAIVKAEDLIEKEEKVNRWQVYANIAPVYYNTLGNGSHIHDQFVNNPKSGEVNTSYGVNVGYAINNKLTIRTGINSLDLSYDTDNVILYESVSNSPDTNPLRNITFAPSAGNISVLSASNVGVQQIDGIIGDNYNAAISQRISYYEVPLELQYRIVNKDFGVNIIGGFSTFFLDGNEVYSEFDDRKTYIGEANNITNVSFSTNIGLGLNYKFTEKLKFNLEPTFKYQLNAFKETSGDFKPYIIGIYTGFSFKF